jgi:hypothetical protein
MPNPKKVVKTFFDDGLLKKNTKNQKAVQKVLVLVENLT